MHATNYGPHQPVLLTEVLECLQPQPRESYLDLTAGYGGHAAAIRARTHGWTAVLVDRDQTAVEYLQAHFTDTQVEIRHQDFLSVSQELLTAGRQFDMILADLGVSSLHLNTASRGFSLQAEGPLDMRMDQRQSLTAEQLVNESSIDDLAKLLHDYGEEPKARAVARAIAAHRPIRSTTQLATIVASVWHGRSRVHPATRTFQALRIAVNGELTMLEQAVPLWIDLLAPGGRLAVISFHSLEDRIVKQAFAARAGAGYDAELRLTTRRPITAATSEVISNPRARSAKLRAAVKIKTERGL
jgi:16S rRNA (cytosine1402-N4)-methyltransferase